MKRKLNPIRRQISAAAVLALSVTSRSEVAQGTEFQPLGKAIGTALGGVTKAQKSSVKVDGKSVTYYYSKDASGKPSRLAFVEQRVYEPNCTHTWVVGLDSKTLKVQAVEVVEMSCPHAFPTRAQEFLGQFMGKGPADASKLEGKVDTIAKATGSSRLTANAVRTSIDAAAKISEKSTGKMK